MKSNIKFILIMTLIVALFIPSNSYATGNTFSGTIDIKNIDLQYGSPRTQYTSDFKVSTYNVDIGVSGITTELDNAYIEIWGDPEKLSSNVKVGTTEFGSITYLNKGVVFNKKVEIDNASKRGIRLYFKNKIVGGDTFTLKEVKMYPEHGIIRNNEIVDLNVALYDSKGTELIKKTISHHKVVHYKVGFNSLSVIKAESSNDIDRNISNSNVYGGLPSKTDSTVIGADKPKEISFLYTVQTGRHVLNGEIIQEGIDPNAKFDPAKNKGWVYDEANRTAKYKINRVTSFTKVYLTLTYPGKKYGTFIDKGKSTFKYTLVNQHADEDSSDIVVPLRQNDVRVVNREYVSEIKNSIGGSNHVVIRTPRVKSMMYFGAYYISTAIDSKDVEIKIDRHADLKYENLVVRKQTSEIFDIYAVKGTTQTKLTATPYESGKSSLYKIPESFDSIVIKSKDGKVIKADKHRRNEEDFFRMYYDFYNEPNITSLDQVLVYKPVWNLVKSSPAISVPTGVALGHSNTKVENIIAGYLTPPVALLSRHGIADAQAGNIIVGQFSAYSGSRNINTILEEPKFYILIPKEFDIINVVENHIFQGLRYPASVDQGNGFVPYTAQKNYNSKGDTLVSFDVRYVDKFKNPDHIVAEHENKGIPVYRVFFIAKDNTPSGEYEVKSYFTFNNEKTANKYKPRLPVYLGRTNEYKNGEAIFNYNNMFTNLKARNVVNDDLNVYTDVTGETGKYAKYFNTDNKILGFTSKFRYTASNSVIASVTAGKKGVADNEYKKDIQLKDNDEFNYKLDIFNNMDSVNKFELIGKLAYKDDYVLVKNQEGIFNKRGSTFAPILKGKITDQTKFDVKYTLDKFKDKVDIKDQNLTWVDTPSDYSKVTGFKLVLKDGQTLVKGDTYTLKIPMQMPTIADKKPEERSVMSFAYNVNDIGFQEGRRTMVEVSFESNKVTGNVFEDSNADGYRYSSVNDLGLKGIEVALYDANNNIVKEGGVEVKTTTDFYGNYTLKTRQTGRFKVKVNVNPKDYVFSPYKPFSENSATQIASNIRDTSYSDEFTLNKSMVVNAGLVPNEVDIYLYKNWMKIPESLISSGNITIPDISDKIILYKKNQSMNKKEELNVSKKLEFTKLSLQSQGLSYYYQRYIAKVKYFDKVGDKFYINDYSLGEKKLDSHWVQIGSNRALVLNNEYVDGSIKTNTIIYEKNNINATGLTIDPKSPYLTGSNVEIMQNNYLLKDYAFVSWNTKPDGTGQSYSPSDKITLDKDIVLYAQWQKDKYSVIYKPNGGVGNMNSTVASEGEAVKIKANEYTRDGFKFIKWNTKPDGTGTDYNADDNFTFKKENLILYAQWKSTVKEKFKIEFDPNGGTGITEAMINLDYNSVVKLRPNGFSKDSHIFRGWSKDKAATTVHYVNNADFTVPRANTILYAVWEKESTSPKATKLTIIKKLFDENNNPIEDKSNFKIKVKGPQFPVADEKSVYTHSPVIYTDIVHGTYSVELNEVITDYDVTISSPVKISELNPKGVIYITGIKKKATEPEKPKDPQLPKTGSKTPYTLWFIGVAFIMLGVFVLFRKKRS